MESNNIDISTMNILDLPPDVTMAIFRHLSFLDVARAVRHTCKAWNQLSYDGCLWREVTVTSSTVPERSFCALLTSIAEHVEKLSLRDTDYLADTYCHDGVSCGRLKHLSLVEDVPDETQVETISHLITKYPRLRSLVCQLTGCAKSLEVLSMLSQMSCLESVSLTAMDDGLGISMTTESFHQLFRDGTCLTSVCLREFQLSDEVLHSLLTNCRGLRSLDLENCYGFGQFAFLDQEDISLENLLYLNITNTPVDDIGFTHILKKSLNMKGVTVFSCPWITDVALSEVGNYCTELSSLYINKSRYMKSNLTNSGLHNIAEHCSKLQRIFVSYCPGVDDIGVLDIADGCPDLRELHIEGCTALTDAAVIELAQKCELLTTLDLSECVQLTSKSVNILITRCRHLCRLGLRTCHRLSKLNFQDFVKVSLVVKDSAPKELARSCNEDQMQGSHKETKPNTSSSAEASGCPLTVDSKQQPKADACSVILSDYKPHSHLRNLDLGFCSQVANASLMQIARHCPDLRELDLEGCTLVTDEGVESLVRGCLFLRTLNISGGSVLQSSSLTNRCLLSIAKHARHLENLMIWKNGVITMEGIYSVVNGCPSLYSVTVSIGPRTEVSLESVAIMARSLPQKLIKIDQRSPSLIDIQVYINKEFNIKTERSASL